VPVAVAADLVGQPFEHQHLVSPRTQRLHDHLELQFLLVAERVRPEVVGQGAVRREHDDEALAPFPVFPDRPGGQAAHAAEEGQGGGGETEVADKITARMMNVLHDNK